MTANNIGARQGEPSGGPAPSSAGTLAGYVDVLVDLPLPEPLTYCIGDDVLTDGSMKTAAAEVAVSSSALLIGRLCVVPVGRRLAVGLIVAVHANSHMEATRVKSLRGLLGDIAPLSKLWLELTRFAADYYQHGWGEVALASLPPGLRVVPGPRFKTTLRRLRRPAETQAAATALAAAPAARLALPPALNAEQASAVAAINAAIESASALAPFLLHGVTGSGKTEVYLALIERLLAREPSAQVLVLVPEINLTPQLEARLRARFPTTPIASLHSGLPAAERTAAWLAVHEERARILLGTRMAVFASVPQLRLIVVDEEHDASFKAGDGARYSARDLAVKRAQAARIAIVLGSATPSLESWRLANDARYARLTLAQRAGAAAERSLPRVELIDIATHPVHGGFAQPLAVALAETTARGEQALVYINRRGYAPVVACDACGWLSTCVRCAAFAAFHKTDRTLRCHHCGWLVRVPRQCPTCGNSALNAVGHGTQRVEETLAALLPGARIARIDRDTTQRRNAANAAFAAVHAGDIDVLVGTQMIAKGHDFRRVSLVGVLNADAQLVAHDFRAPERLFATLLQVAGRAGRSGMASRVLVQTRFPGHPLFGALARFDYPAFAAQQLAQRRAAAMPPYVHQALLTAEARTLEGALGFLQEARALGAARAEGVTLYDPVPMPLARLAGVDRAQLVIESARRKTLQTWLAAWLADLRNGVGKKTGGLRWQIEVDPLSI